MYIFIAYSVGTVVRVLGSTLQGQEPVRKGRSVHSLRVEYADEQNLTLTPMRSLSE